MGFFSLFKKKKQPIEDIKWNAMWELWAEERALSPYAELMTYESEVNNGGHMQFFDNAANTSLLPQTLSALNTLLTGVLAANLDRAYHIYLTEEDEDTKACLLDECDNVFYENESEIEAILREYAKTIDVPN
ncbi:MAG: DUF4375 domain-containing protein [Clostridia bacterium]|nr:DUF4375 domain-containing protein [Clostridia bacterium]